MGRRSQVTASVRVERPAEEVFDYLVDVTRHAEWSQRPYRAEGVTLPLAVGSTFTSYGRIPGDKNEHTNAVTVTAVDRPTKFAITSDEKGEQFVNTFTLTADGAATKVERLMDLPVPSGVVGVLFPLIKAAVINPGVNKGLHMFKARAEGK